MSNNQRVSIHRACTRRLSFLALALAIVACTQGGSAMPDAQQVLSCDQARAAANSWIDANVASYDACTEDAECVLWVPSEPDGRAYGVCSRAVRLDSAVELEAAWVVESVHISGMLHEPCNESATCIGRTPYCNASGRCELSRSEAP
jgi:hypothetical protein